MPNVVVYCPKEYKKRHKHAMRKYHLSWTGDSFCGRITPWQYENLEQYCINKHLKYKIDNGFGERSTDYRKTFFQNNKPVIKDMYFCAYCGKLLSRRKLTVDHLYPVAKAQRSLDLQKKLRRSGISNINDAQNLVPACMRCNQHKSANMGLWILKGKIGRHKWIWELRHALRISILITAAYYCYTTGFYLRIIDYFR